MNSDSVELLLIEAATTAKRDRDRAGIPLPHAAWADLTPQGRRALYEAQLTWRALERLHHPEGRSATAREVLSRISRIEQE